MLAKSEKRSQSEVAGGDKITNGKVASRMRPWNREGTLGKIRMHLDTG